MFSISGLNLSKMNFKPSSVTCPLILILLMAECTSASFEEPKPGKDFYSFVNI